MKKQLIFFIDVIISFNYSKWYISAPLPYNKEEIHMDYDRAEIIAINSLSFVASDEKILAGYLNLSGTDLSQIKENLANPETMTGILAGVLDYLLQNEKYLIDFSENYQLDPAEISAARHCFPGAIHY